MTESRLEEATAEKVPATCYFVAYANADDFLLPLTLNSLDFLALTLNHLKNEGFTSIGLKQA